MQVCFVFCDCTSNLLPPGATGDDGEDDGDNDSGTRYQYLTQKFWAVRDTLDPSIPKMWDEAHKSQLGTRAQRRKILKELFDRKGKSWTVNPNKPFFKVETEVFNGTENRDANNGMVRVLMAEKFRDGEDGLKAALANPRSGMYAYTERGIDMIGFKSQCTADVNSGGTRQTLGQALRPPLLIRQGHHHICSISGNPMFNKSRV